MKKAYEYLDGIEAVEFSQSDDIFYRNSAVEELIKKAQIDAIGATVKMCAENAKLLEISNWGRFEDADKDKNPIIMEHDKIKKNNFGHGDCTYQIITVSKQSILQVAEELKKELE